MASGEDSIKRKCVKYLKKIQMQERLWFYCPSDKFYSGIPDILLCFRSKFYWTELKTANGTVSPIQAWTHSEICLAGGFGMICRSFDEFKDFIEMLLKKED